jgi:hypothetical protein
MTVSDPHFRENSKRDSWVTWNCLHLANANKFGHIRRVNTMLGQHSVGLSSRGRRSLHRLPHAEDLFGLFLDDTAQISLAMEDPDDLYGLAFDAVEKHIGVSEVLRRFGAISGRSRPISGNRASACPFS